MSLVFGFALLIAVASLPGVGRWLRDQTVGPLVPDAELGLALEGVANAIDLIGYLFIGGAVFSSQLSKLVQDKAAEYEQALATAFGHESHVINADIDASIHHIEELIERARWAGLGRTIWDGWKEARRLYALVFDIPVHYGRYAWTMVVTRFPGGFFGMLAFLTFGASACLKTAKLWVEMGG